MNRYPAIHGLRGQSQASPTTTCQKCLKKDNYECKASAQERPYVSRPSRTQQLFNPKLAPQLTNDAPFELLRRKGVADEQLAKKAEERNQSNHENSITPPPPISYTRKRSRSNSSHSTDSVSTISTGRSLSPKRARHESDDQYVTSQQDLPDFPTYPFDKRKRRYSSSTQSSSPSESSDTRTQRRHNGRRRRKTISPVARGRPIEDRRGSHRSKSRSRRRDRSRDYSRVARDRKSMTPISVDHLREHNAHSRQGDQPFARMRDIDRSTRAIRHAKSDGTYAPQRQERSLSPYSKRIALTQAMNRG